MLLVRVVYRVCSFVFTLPSFKFKIDIFSLCLNLFVLRKILDLLVFAKILLFSYLVLFPGMLMLMPLITKMKFSFWIICTISFPNFDNQIWILFYFIFFIIVMRANDDKSILFWEISYKLLKIPEFFIFSDII